jgi:hypothetical protein
MRLGGRMVLDGALRAAARRVRRGLVITDRFRLTTREKRTCGGARDVDPA